MGAPHRAGDGIRFAAMHPGWADTPGLSRALPGFARLMGPLLRTPAQGADTIVWLAADRRDRPLGRLALARPTAAAVRPRSRDPLSTGRSPPAVGRRRGLAGLPDPAPDHHP